MTAATALASKTVVVDGREFPYVETGSGTPVVFLHGAGGNKLTAFHDLLGADHRAIMIVQPGFEGTPEPDDTITDREYAALVGAAARAIAGAPFHLVGTSFGSRIASWVAVDSPADVLSLSLLAPALLKREGGPAGLPKPPASLSPEQAEQYTRQMTLVQRLNANDNSVQLARLGALTVPLSLTFGATDPIILATLSSKYAELYPAAVVSVVDDAGHALYADQPEAVLAQVLATVGRAQPAAAGPRPWKQILASIDPAGADLLNAYIGHSMDESLGGIDLVTAELILIATSTAVNQPGSIRTHVVVAQKAGATNAQIYQALLLGSHAGGVTSLGAGLRVLDEVLDLD